MTCHQYSGRKSLENRCPPRVSTRGSKLRRMTNPLRDGCPAVTVPRKGISCGALASLLTRSWPVTFRGLARHETGALAPSPANEKPQSHYDPNRNENLAYHPEFPPKKSTDFHVDNPSICGHSNALLSASLRPRGRSGQYAVDYLARREHPDQLVSRTLSGMVASADLLGRTNRRCLERLH